MQLASLCQCLLYFLVFSLLPLFCVQESKASHHYGSLEHFRNGTRKAVSAWIRRITTTKAHYPKANAHTKLYFSLVKMSKFRENIRLWVRINLDHFQFLFVLQRKRYTPERRHFAIIFAWYTSLIWNCGDYVKSLQFHSIFSKNIIIIISSSISLLSRTIFALQEWRIRVTSHTAKTFIKYLQTKGAHIWKNRKEKNPKPEILEQV